jgi:hypothetical protein
MTRAGLYQQLVLVRSMYKRSRGIVIESASDTSQICIAGEISVLTADAVLQHNCYVSNEH